MECCICQLWARMPYHKRYTTPTTAQETEGALVVGYWLHRSLENSVPRMCEKHMAILSLLDQQEEARIAAEQAAAEAATQQRTVINQAEVVRIAQVLAPNPATAHMQNTQQQQQIDALQAHQRELIEGLPKPPMQPPFTLGPGPLQNENSTSPQPPLPLETNLAAPYTGVVPPNAPPTAVAQQGNQKLLDELVARNAANPVKPGTPEGALEAARMTPVEGAKVTVPCGLCGKPVTTGEVHAC